MPPWGGTPLRPPVLVPLALLLLALLAAPPAHAAGWLPLEPATSAGDGTPTNPRVAVDDAGNVYAVWLLGTEVQASKRPVGGTFEPPQSLDRGVTAATPDIAVDGAGNAVAVWQAMGAGNSIREARRGAGASAFGAASTVPLAGTINDTPRVVANRAGEAVLAWAGGPGSNSGVRVSVASTTTAFPSPVVYDEGLEGSFPPDVAINEAGDAVAVWRFNAGSAIHAAYRPRGGSFTQPREVVPTTTATNQDPRVAIDSGGRSLAVWRDSHTAPIDIEAATRPSGANPAWSALDDLDGPSTSGEEPRVAFDATDAAVGAWSMGGELRSSILPAGAAQFTQPPLALTDAKEDPNSISLDAGANGTIALVWAFGGGDALTRAVVRSNGGGFGATATLTPSGNGGLDTSVAVDPSGNAAAVWIDSSPPEANPRVVSAEYDATPPKLSGLAVPLLAAVNGTTSFSVSAADDWSQPGVAWDFGDGTGGSGGSPTHVYTAPGEYRVTATATDAAGNSTQASGTVTAIRIPVPPPPTPPPVIGQSFNAEKVKGKVLVSVPKAKTPKPGTAPAAHSAAALTPPKGYTRFVPLEEQRHIPIGSLIDASRGTVKLTMAANRAGTLRQTGNLSKGAFKTSQRRGRALTTLTMMSRDDFRRGCRTSRPRRLGTSSARRRPRRQLFSNVHGRFRTRGRHSTATVRGTQYLVKDTCAGTLTSVRRGVVVVQDLVKHRRRTLHRGQRYLARPRRLR